MESKQTVVHFITSLKFGGAERFLMDVYPYLDHQCCEHIIYPLIQGGELLAHYDYAIHNSDTAAFWSYVFHGKHWSAKIFKPLLPLYYTYRAWQYLNSNKEALTVVYICQLGIAFSVAHKLWSLKSKRKTLWILRIGSDIDSPIYFPKFIANWCAGMVKPVFNKMIAQAPYIMTVDAELSQKISNSYQKHSRYIRTITNCASLPLCVTDGHLAIPIQINEHCFVAIGRLHYQKGFDILIRVFARFIQRFPQYKLIILGEGGQRKELEAIVRDNRLDNHVFLPGFIANPETILPKVAACIVSSRSEGFCKVIVEAMMMKAIVIASNCDFGPRSIIRHQVNGFLYENGNEEALFDALVGIISLTNEEVFAIKEAAFKRAQDYTPCKVGKDYQEYLFGIRVSNLPH